MATLSTIIPMVKDAIAQIQASQGMSTAQKKVLAASFIQKMVASSSLSDTEKEVLNTVLPLLANDFAEIEKDAKSCFSFCTSKAKAV